MLTSLVLSLTALTDAQLPASLGRASQALFYRLLDHYNPALAETLHNAEGPKPYTTSNLVLGRRQNHQLNVQAGQTGWIRLTGLTRDVSGPLLAIATNPPERVELDRVEFAVNAATVDPAQHPWAGKISYQDFAAPFLLAAPAELPHQMGLEFVSPTTFRSQAVFVPFPLPEQVFGSLLLRWQTFAPIALNPEVRRFAEEMVVANRYNLNTVSLPYKQGGLRIGFVGEITYTTLNQDRYWLSVLHLLANYAFFSGVGYQTTMGMGQVRVIC